MTATRKRLSIELKMEVIKCFESGENNSEISQKFQLPSSTVSTILKNHKAIRHAYENNQTSAKRLRKADKADLDDALYEWLKHHKQSNGALSRRILSQQAEKLAAELGYQNFVCSHSWLDRFKNRHKVEFHKNVSSSRISPDWLENWSNIKSDFEDKDIFIVDKTDVCFKINEKKFSENSVIHRSTVFLCTNLTVTEKRKLIVVEKFECLEIFGDLPVNYFPNKKSSTALDIFQAEVFHWDYEYQSTGRKILLLIEEPRREHEELKFNLNNIETVFVPCNHTSILCEVGMNYHNHFRDLLLDFQINRRKMKPRTGYQLSGVEALNLMKEAWDKVTTETIVNCLRILGLVSGDFDSTLTVAPEMTTAADFNEFEGPSSSAESTSNYFDQFCEEAIAGSVKPEPQFEGMGDFETYSQAVTVKVDLDAVKAENEESCEGNGFRQNLTDVPCEVKIEPQWDELSEVDENMNVEKVSMSEAQDAIRTLENFYKSNDGISSVFEVYLEKLKIIMSHMPESDS